MKRPGLVGALALLLFMPGPAGAQNVTIEADSIALPAPGQPLAPPLPPLEVFPIQLVLDDDMAEAATGVIGAGGARQFLWFNRFTSAGDFRLEEIWVLFPPGANMTIGANVELVVYHDSDNDPTNGADLLATMSETIQVLDGVTFSIYPIAPALEVPGGGDVLIGVVDRFVASGVTPPTFPAAIDTTTSQQRSWLATWSGDPPAPPELPSDGAMVLLDDLLPAVAGTWMIRGFGTGPPILEIPTVDRRGLALLFVVLAACGLIAVRAAAR